MEPYNEPRSAFWGRGTIAAGVLLLILLLLAAYVLFGRNGSNHNATPTPSPVTTTPQGSAQPGNTSTTTSRPATSTSCNLPDSDQSIPEATPLGITWNLYQTVALPSSKTAGPQIVHGDIAECFAHTPLGALIAATQISFRLVVSPSTDVAREEVVPGPGRTLFIRADEKAIEASSGNQPGDFDQSAGFKFVTYSPAVAVVELATKSDSGTLQASTITVEWTHGDWKLALESNGNTTPNVLPLSSLVGYSTWAGV